MTNTAATHWTEPLRGEDFDEDEAWGMISAHHDAEIQQNALQVVIEHYLTPKPHGFLAGSEVRP